MNVFGTLSVYMHGSAGGSIEAALQSTHNMHALPQLPFLVMASSSDAVRLTLTASTASDVDVLDEGDAPPRNEESDSEP